MIQHHLCKVIGKMVEVQIASDVSLFFVNSLVSGNSLGDLSNVRKEGRRSKRKRLTLSVESRGTALGTDSAQSMTKTPSSAPSLGHGGKAFPEAPLGVEPRIILFTK